MELKGIQASYEATIEQVGFWCISQGSCPLEGLEELLPGHRMPYILCMREYTQSVILGTCGKLEIAFATLDFRDLPLWTVCCQHEVSVFALKVLFTWCASSE